MKKWLNQLGPATLVTAAFVGPGTVTVCAQAGVRFDFSLLWALLLSVGITIVLQEMAARIGLVQQKDLATVLRESIVAPVLKNAIIGLVLAAIVLGNAAYEAGNINGAVMGLEIITHVQQPWLWPILSGAIAFGLLYLGNHKVLERALLGLVIFMSLSFIATALITQPDYGAIFQGLIQPTIHEDNILMVLALIGTTVVPYNLFLHASLVKKKWQDTAQLTAVRTDTIVAISLGGLVSMAILITGASMPGNALTRPVDLAAGLQPLFGNSAAIFTGLGLFAAGITSSITAPFAAAIVIQSCFGWTGGMKSKKFRASWMGILLIGLASTTLSFSPIVIIQFAQLANGVLLPIMAALLWWLSSSKKILGQYRNGTFLNVLSFFLLLTTIALSIRTLSKVLF